LLNIKNSIVRYQYVVKNGSNAYSWIPDPHVPGKDGEGNTVFDIEKLYGEPSEGGDKVGIQWRPYSQLDAERVFRDTGNIYCYIRIDGNERCESFEKRYLLTKTTGELFSGKIFFFLDARNREYSPELKAMGVQRVPALAFRDNTGDWRVLHFDENIQPPLVLSFLEGS
jgi:hypothetical protein